MGKDIDAISMTFTITKRLEWCEEDFTTRDDFEEFIKLLHTPIGQNTVLCDNIKNIEQDLKYTDWLLDVKVKDVECFRLIAD